MKFRPLLLLSALLASPVEADVDVQKMPERHYNGLAPTPPMGWNSWNRFGCKVDETLVRKAADQMVATGMKAAGYTYIVIDDCWQGPRDAKGFITADGAKFPSGMKALGDYIHDRGLKFGIYSDAGYKTCGGRPGSQGHEYQDAATYAEWGVDFLKYDWCYTGPRDPSEAYALMSDALNATGRPVLLSVCEWGRNKPWEWGRPFANTWRTTLDIADRWDGELGVLSLIDQNEPLWPHAGPGHWNDPDMLQVGNGGMTNAEYRSHFAIWAIMAAPLMAGNDLSAMDPATNEILLNREVIAVNQDRLGIQGHRVTRDGEKEVWSKPLADGGRAVLLFNRSSTPAVLSVAWEQLGYPSGIALPLRDLLHHRGMKTGSRVFEATVQPHDVVMVRVGPSGYDRRRGNGRSLR